MSDQSKWAGSMLSKVSSEPQFDPQLGEVTKEIWVGTQGAIYNLGRILQESQIRYSISHNGPVYTLSATLGARQDTTEQEVPVDTYEFDTEFSQPSAWTSDKVFSAAGSSQTTLNAWRRAIENAIKGIDSAGTPSATGGPLDESATGFTDNKLKLYRLFVRGVESVEVGTITLNRTRTYSTQYATRMQLDFTERVWTTSALVRDFLIPADVAALMPSDPSATPSDSAWSWKIRKQSFRPLRKDSRIEESLSFVFKAWSTMLYTLVS
jgi:hypothetical protein